MPNIDFLKDKLDATIKEDKNKEDDFVKISLSYSTKCIKKIYSEVKNVVAGDNFIPTVKYFIELGSDIKIEDTDNNKQKTQVRIFPYRCSLPCHDYL